jgi:hypothetical protein
MANRGFCRISSTTTAGDGSHRLVAQATCFLLDEDDAIINGAGCSAEFGHSDSSQSIHQQLADNYRNVQDDQSIVVVFLDSPGRY